MNKHIEVPSYSLPIYQVTLIVPCHPKSYICLEADYNHYVAFDIPKVNLKPFQILSRNIHLKDIDLIWINFFKNKNTST